MADLERSEKLMVALNAIERKADIIRMTAATPPQDQNTKRFDTKKWFFKIIC